MIPMPETTIYEVLFSRIYRACSMGKNVDIVGVTSSILVTPTIPISLKIKTLKAPQGAFCVFPYGFTEPCRLRFTTQPCATAILAFLWGAVVQNANAPDAVTSRRALTEART